MTIKAGSEMEGISYVNYSGMLKRPTFQLSRLISISQNLDHDFVQYCLADESKAALAKGHQYDRLQASHEELQALVEEMKEKRKKLDERIQELEEFKRGAEIEIAVLKGQVEVLRERK